MRIMSQNPSGVAGFLLDIPAVEIKAITWYNAIIILREEKNLIIGWSKWWLA